MRTLRNIEASLLANVPIAMARRRVSQLGREHPRGAGLADAQTQRHIYVDFTLFSQEDSGTGIQRVVREMAEHWAATPPEGDTLVALRAGDDHRFRQIAWPSSAARASRATAPARQPGPGDIFLALDFCPRSLPRSLPELLQWKRDGVSVQVVLYDMLPMLRSDWFTPLGARNFRRWLRVISIVADKIHCISEVVKRDYLAWWHRCSGFDAEPPVLRVFPLGGDFGVRLPAVHDDDPDHEYVDTLVAGADPYVLVVGTVEPRKAYDEVLGAFDSLWRSGETCRLVIVGAPGWNTDSVQTGIRSHCQCGNRLHWMEGASDASLHKLYKGCAGVLLSSRGEGLGLPLLEAQHHRKPALARDIPIFREFASGLTTFFGGASVALTARDLARWLASLPAATGGGAANESHWHTGCAALLAHLDATDPISSMPAVRRRRAAT